MLWNKMTDQMQMWVDISFKMTQIDPKWPIFIEFIVSKMDKFDNFDKNLPYRSEPSKIFLSITVQKEKYHLSISAGIWLVS